MNKYLDLVGQRYGRLTVMEFVKTEKKQAFWKCLCDCGKTTVVARGNLQTGNTTSCGCKLKEHPPRSPNAKASYNPSYISWRAMFVRCKISAEKTHVERYQKRGIFIHPDWFDFDTFLRDMGPRPAGTSLERINNDAGYSKENCRWATHKEQCRNRSSNRIIEAFGTKGSIAEFAERHQIPYATLMRRIRSGWKPERALTTPIRQKKHYRTKGEPFAP